MFQVHTENIGIDIHISWQDIFDTGALPLAKYSNIPTDVHIKFKDVIIRNGITMNRTRSSQFESDDSGAGLND